jgi:Ricin-type beta-trefoil lectin domain-like/Bacterial Ig-like domain (group 2)
MFEHCVRANASTFKTIQRSGTHLYASSARALYFPYLPLNNPAVSLKGRLEQREQVYAEACLQMSAPLEEQCTHDSNCSCVRSVFVTNLYPITFTGSLRPRAICCLPLLLLAVFFQPSLSHAQSLRALSISPNQPSVNIGGTTQLTATATYSDGSSTNISSSVAWSSADPRMASVSASGIASGSATGNVAITASYQGQTASTTISSSMGNIQWSGPLTITQGGTYSGNWKSTNPNTPAVTVATTAPVVIQNSYVTGPNDLIADPYYGNNLTVKNVTGLGVNPNVSGQSNGLFVNAQNPILLDVENCYFENVLFGVYVRGYGGNRDGIQTITILNNRGRNILGLESDGKNGYLPGETNWQWAHAIQLSEMASVPGIRIAWNEIINYPYQSLVNENVNMYDAGGTSSSPVEFHDNYIQGAYAYNPPVDSYNGGGFVTDGSGSDTVATASAYNNVYNNQVVGTVNMGIEFSTGHDNVAWNNTVIASGLLPNGTKIPSQNVGLVIDDVYGNIPNGSMYNNDMYGNTVGWMCWAARCAWDGYRNDDYFPNNSSYYSTNQSISANPITLQAENSEYSTWLAKISSNGMVVGPVAPASASSGGGSPVGPTISTAAWYYIVNTNSSLCVDALNWGYLDGTVVQQYTCGAAQTDQEWQFQPTDSGYYQVVNRNALIRTGQNLVWEVAGGPWATGNQVPVELWSYGGGTNQQWMPVSLGNGAYKFIARNSSKCLDVPGASSAVLTALQQFDCNGTGAQSYTLQQK